MANNKHIHSSTSNEEASTTTPLLKSGRSDIGENTHDEETSTISPLSGSGRSDTGDSNSGSTGLELPSDTDDGNSGLTGQEFRSDTNKWNSKRNRHNPRNWVRWYKWATVILVSFIELLTTMPNFMYAPNITDAQKDLNTDDDTLATFSLTIYILGFGLGPLLFAPLSEMYGRAVIYRACLAVFLAMTVGCALSSNIGMLVAFRFLAGSFGAAPVAIGGAVVGDLFQVSERGTAMSIYQAGQIIAAVIGPPIGGLIGAYMHWRWVFWIVCILAAVALLFTFVVLRETHAPTLKNQIHSSNSYNNDTGEPEGKSSLLTELQRALSRPLKLGTKSPVVFLCCLLIFLVIGMLNVFLTEMSRVFQKVYNMSSAESGSVYLGLALGFVLASAVFGATNDRVMQMLTRKYQGKTQPEYRLPATMVAMPFVAVGLVWYGWTLEFKLSWILPIVGSGLSGFGITTVQLSITTYLVDSFDEFSASALAAITMARSIGGALFPLVGPPLYKQLGQGWGNSVLALMSLVCCTIPVLLYRYGAKWRAKFSSSDL